MKSNVINPPISHSTVVREQQGLTWKAKAEGRRVICAKHLSHWKENVHVRLSIRFLFRHRRFERCRQSALQMVCLNSQLHDKTLHVPRSRRLRNVRIQSSISWLVAWWKKKPSCTCANHNVASADTSSCHTYFHCTAPTHVWSSC